MRAFQGRRLSWVRVGVLVVGISALVFTGLSGWRWFQDVQAADGDEAWFAAYADATVTPQVAFEEPATAAARNVVLSFVVASPDNPCRPSWGRDYSLDEAATDLDLDRRIARLRQNGGEAMVSFGGAANDELATVCTDEDKLGDAYGAVVDRYDLRTVDLDLEGPGLTDAAAQERRADALATLQETRAGEDGGLRVWVTLPVAPQGLTTEGQAAVSALLSAGVEIAGVNVMTMNYGAGRESGQSMLDASISALEATHDQLGRVYAKAGQDVGPATVWKRMGATPMIGQNDEYKDVFDVADARELNDFARSKGLGRLSMWSLNRDLTCGANYPDVRVVSNSCSGVDQGELSFAQLLAKGMGDRADSGAVAPTASEPPSAVATADDPARSPYPVWSADQTYVEGTRVVWHRNVYLAKWWTSGDLPDDPTVDEFSSPWSLVGPVLPGEKPAPDTELPEDLYPAWDTDDVYRKGERVLQDGVAFAAKWWTQGDSPSARSTQAEPSPWRRLTDTELRKALDADD